MRFRAGAAGLLFLLLGALAPAALAQPSIPATYFGSATIDGQSVPPGTPVRAFVNGKDCSQPGPPDPKTVMDGGVSAYAIIVMHESQEPGCAEEGDTVTFTVDGREAAQRATWKTGPQRLDLNVGSGQTVPLPTATPTATPNATQAAATATATARTNPSGTVVPPTDDIQLPTTPQPGGPARTVTATNSPGIATPTPTPTDPQDTETHGIPVLGTILGTLVLLVACGIFGGYMLARRSKGPPPPTDSQ
ncbi:MAG: hypothetical protein IT303_09920 [Dehalococcoidia bacterium]|nr:hypothetical protein [Dehalococcoidia bacterium]